MIRWCGEELPWEASKYHFLVTGATGSGKTVLLRVFMQSVLENVGRTERLKAIVYDPKQDFLPALDAILEDEPNLDGWPTSRIKILNPFDVRGVSWDIASDTTNPALARQVAAILVPEDENSASPFFARAAQDIAYGVILSFIQTGLNWTFRDLVLALTQDAALTKQLLEMSNQNQNRVKSFFSKTETSQSVWATLQTKVSMFEPIAAGWSYASESVSLRDWLHSSEGSVIILRTNQAVREAIDGLNAVLFRRLSELILDEPDDSGQADEGRVWVFLDEAREAGKLEGLRALMNMGRSKRCSVVLTFQDIEGLKAVYGESEALELTGQCGNKAVLRLESPATADWASSLFGPERVELGESSTGVQAGSGAQISSGESRRIVDRPRVIPSEFFLLPASGAASGVHGIGKRFDQAKPYRFHMKPFPEVGLDERLSDRARSRRKLWEPSDIEAVEPRPDRELFLDPWNESDLERLGLKQVGASPPTIPRRSRNRT